MSDHPRTTSPDGCSIDTARAHNELESSNPNTQDQPGPLTAGKGPRGVMAPRHLSSKSPSEAGELQRLPAQLNNVSAWLNNGCDPKHAATELGLIASRLQALAAAPAEGAKDE